MANRAQRRQRIAAPTVALETIADGEASDVVEAPVPTSRERLVPLRPRVVLRRPGRSAVLARFVRDVRPRANDKDVSR